MHIKAQQYHGQLLAPASKSHGQRLLLLSLLTSHPFELQQLGADKDTSAMRAAVQSIKAQANKAVFKSILVEESGFALRTLALLGAAFYKHYELSGSGTLLKRQHWATIKVLEQLGLEVSHQNGLLPIQVSGQITQTKLNVDGSEGSQYVSGLFFLAAKHPGAWQIEIQHLNSQPYFELTLQTLELAGFEYQKKRNTYFFKGAQDLKLDTAIVEGDWSSVAAHLAGAAIKGKISVSGLNSKSIQPDRTLLHALKQFGAYYRWEKDQLIVTESERKYPFEFDVTHQPDLFPVLVVLACAAKGTSCISGVQRLKNKESDRLKAMCEALNKWGVRYALNGQDIRIHGTGTLAKASIDTYNDHRIVKAGCLASLLSAEGQELAETSAIEKSYPRFIEDFVKLTQV